VFQAYFDYCSSGAAQTAFFVSSSYGRARVWSVQTTRAVDLECAGAPSAAEVASRVSYMRVPDFFEPSTADCGDWDLPKVQPLTTCLPTSIEFEV
jgi:hypothetical protein